MIFIHGGIHKFYGAFLECTECFAECLQLGLRMSAVSMIVGQVLPIVASN
jgi:hypothetical protein